ncbi:hypothetical protein EZV62_003523 [Acer yangbiense]|uniref:FHA domain-containing protein n=1 Tax=Acer yangbiense TaxID=1000413 RepID=A0A5C7IHK0_9ROSI|nr:hypothetical protein EZV62_003523 [Acer yangbiense]
MEIAGEDGSSIPLNPNSTTVFGRGSGFSTADRIVSRRHVLFSLKESDSDSVTRTEPRVRFEVIGKNPIWVRSREGGEVRVFRRREKGEVAAGDWLCVSGQSPVWFALKRNVFGEEKEESEIVEPKFGFLVIGHEFDHYPKQRIRDIRNWDWFLEEPRKDSDEDDEVSDKRKKGGRRRKRGKDEGNDDGDWTGESEEDKEVIAKVRKVQRLKYSTRSKDGDNPQKGTKHSSSSVQKNAVSVMGEESEDEEDPTLGGFIVEDDNAEGEEESDADEEEADEDFDEDDDEP